LTAAVTGARQQRRVDDAEQRLKLNLIAISIAAMIVEISGHAVKDADRISLEMHQYRIKK